VNIESCQAEKHRVQFRFYEELNDFLSLARQRQTFSYEFDGRPSLKEAIETIGVPHTEIDLILVNGDSVDFCYQLQGGERIAVYPVFERFDIAPVIRLRPKPLRITRFIVDVNLGKLARYLRLLGFDTVYQHDLDDQTIVRIAGREKRIIVTRDTGILEYKGVTRGYWVRNTKPRQQLHEVVNNMQLQSSFNPFTLCADCNGTLRAVKKAIAAGRRPKDTLRIFNPFRECPDCHKIWWQGSLYDRICELIRTLKNQC
jgi:uncharacterized protein with PIN domain